MATDKLQYRSLNTEFEADIDSRKIHGLAIPVNSRSAFIHDYDGDYFEVILPSAVNDELISSNDIKIYLDHDSSQGTFARSKYGKGSLNLYVTERGLEFDFEAPKNAMGDFILEGIQRGDYDAISWAFLPNDDYWEYDENKEPVHYIRSFKLITEISILSLRPAYPATELDLRSLQEFKDEQETKHNESVRKIEEIADDLNNLYSKYLNICY